MPEADLKLFLSGQRLSAVRSPRRIWLWLLLGIVAGLPTLLAGCDTPINAFDANRVYAKRLEIGQDLPMDTVSQDVNAILVELFGTPNDPQWPEEFVDSENSDFISLERLQRAAGPVRSEQDDTHFGLYREHCVLCHGLSGDGLGATSRLLNPYPRDFRLGKFKFKSTPRGHKPTRGDLDRILQNGIVGTSMPSFQLLDDDDRQALIDYVIYLSIRGEVERQLLSLAAFQLDDDERLIDPTRHKTPGSLLAETGGDSASQDWGNEVRRIVSDVVDSWRTAEQTALNEIALPPDFPIWGADSLTPNDRERLQASVARGFKIFQGKTGSCSSCHGATAMGDGPVANYDDWTNDWTVGAGLDPRDKEQLRPMLQLGALKPRTIQPRNLRSGIFRGGSQPEDLYRRIVHGIEGTPMPAVPLQPDNPLGLTQTEVWDLVNYLLSLSQASDAGQIQ